MATVQSVRLYSCYSQYTRLNVIIFIVSATAKGGFSWNFWNSPRSATERIQHWHWSQPPPSFAKKLSSESRSKHDWVGSLRWLELATTCSVPCTHRRISHNRNAHASTFLYKFCSHCDPGVGQLVAMVHEHVVGVAYFSFSSAHFEFRSEIQCRYVRLR